VATAATAARSLRRLTLLALAALALISALAIGPASASTAATAQTSCPSTVERPFVRWLDPAAYTLAPGGDFESWNHRWQLSGGAKVVSGNEPFKVHGTADARSLSIPAGGSAVSPPFCAGLGEPTLRLFAVGGSLNSWLKVEVLYPTLFGPASQTVALVPRMGAWGPTLQTPMLGNVLGLTSLGGLTTTVQVRLTALGGVGWKVDDVYVDPWKVT
jgi:hypothetical protein